MPDDWGDGIPNIMATYDERDLALAVAPKAVNLLRVHALPELCHNAMPEVLLPGLMVKGAVALFVSEPHVGKTMLGLDLMMALALGQEFLAVKPVKRVRSVALFVDSPLWGMRAQFEALAAGRGLRAPYAELGDMVCYRGRAPDFRLDLATNHDTAALIETCVSQSAEFLFLDCFSNLCSADENNRGVMQEVMERLAYVAQTARVCVMVTDHTPVAGRIQRSVYQARGSSVKEAMADTVWHAQRRKDQCELRVMKARGMPNAGDT